jgi:hypothetical protein
VAVNDYVKAALLTPVVGVICAAVIGAVYGAAWLVFRFIRWEYSQVVFIVVCVLAFLYWMALTIVRDGHRSPGYWKGEPEPPPAGHPGFRVER